MTINDRIKMVQDAFEIKSQKAFSDRIGIAQSTYNKILVGADPRCSTIENLLTSFPTVSAEWLLRGDGNMIKTESASINIDASETKFQNTAPVQIGQGNHNSGSDEMIKLLAEQVKQQQELINKLMAKL